MAAPTIVTFIGGPMNLVQQAVSERDVSCPVIRFLLPDPFRFTTQLTDELPPIAPTRIAEYHVYRLPQRHKPEPIYVGIWVDGSGYLSSVA